MAALRIGVHPNNLHLQLAALTWPLRWPETLLTPDGLPAVQFVAYGEGRDTGRLIADDVIDVGGTGSTPPCWPSTTVCRSSMSQRLRREAPTGPSSYGRKTAPVMYPASLAVASHCSTGPFTHRFLPPSLSEKACRCVTSNVWSWHLPMPTVH